MTAIQISACHLRTASIFSAQKDIRPCLNGVLVDVTSKAIYCVGSDGAMLGVTRQQHDGSHVGQYIIPTDVLKTLKMQKNVTDKYELEFLAGNRFRLSAGGFIIDSAFVDSTYPDWRRLVPDSAPSGVSAQFDIAKLNDYYTAAQTLSLRKTRPPTVTVGHNGRAGAPVNIAGYESEFLGIIMPLCCDYAFNTFPTE